MNRDDTAVAGADARKVLHRHLRSVRGALLWGSTGSPSTIRRPLTPTGTNLLDLVTHLSIVEALLVHEVAETNRHAGSAGMDPGNPNLPEPDAQWWESYRARVEQAARRAEPNEH